MCGSQLIQRHPLDDLQTLGAKVLRQGHAARREHLKRLFGDSLRLQKSVEVVLAQELKSTGCVGNALDVASLGHFSVPFYVLSYALRRHGTRI